jgi:hypothetical protein
MAAQLVTARAVLISTELVSLMAALMMVVMLVVMSVVTVVRTEMSHVHKSKSKRKSIPVTDR